MDFEAPMSTWMLSPPRRPAVTFDLQNLTRSSVEAVIHCKSHRDSSISSWYMVFTRFDIDGLLWPWPLTSGRQNQIQLSVRAIKCLTSVSSKLYKTFMRYRGNNSVAISTQQSTITGSSINDVTLIGERGSSY